MYVCIILYLIIWNWMAKNLNIPQKLGISPQKIWNLRKKTHGYLQSPAFGLAIAHIDDALLWQRWKIHGLRSGSAHGAAVRALFRDGTYGGVQRAISQ